jgi:external thioesterase TEII
MKIIAFTFAGGSKYSFKQFSNLLNDFTVLEYPGRGTRVNEELLFDVNLIIEDLLPKVIQESAACDQYVIYGHSMGAMVGYLICQRLQELEYKLPVKLIISGRKPPTVGQRKKISHFEDLLFWQEVLGIGGIPNELSKHPELMNFYIPILKADFRAVENYQYYKFPKLKLAIDVFYGNDEGIKESEINKWVEESHERVIIKALPGNHFFIFNHENYFINYFKKLDENLYSYTKQC